MNQPTDNKLEDILNSFCTEDDGQTIVLHCSQLEPLITALRQREERLCNEARVDNLKVACLLLASSGGRITVTPNQMRELEPNSTVNTWYDPATGNKVFELQASHSLDTPKEPNNE